MKLFDFDQERERLFQQIKSKDKEKENETKIFAQIQDYLLQQKLKTIQEKADWEDKKKEREAVNSDLMKNVENNYKCKEVKNQQLNENIKKFEKGISEIQLVDKVQV